jgi:NifU-like protein involved in Fe-S cluster formation
MYSDRLLELFHNPAHAGRVDGATHRGEAGTPGQGPYTRLWLRVRDGEVEAAGYQTYGCPAIISCMEALCRTVQGRILEETRALVTADEVAQWVGGVPDEKTHCPALAARAWTSCCAVGQ